MKAASERDTTSAADEELDFDEDTLRGQMKHATYLSGNVDSMERR